MVKNLFELTFQSKLRSYRQCWAAMDDVKKGMREIDQIPGIDDFNCVFLAYCFFKQNKSVRIKKTQKNNDPVLNNANGKRKCLFDEDDQVAVEVAEEEDDESFHGDDSGEEEEKDSDFEEKSHQPKRKREMQNNGSPTKRRRLQMKRVARLLKRRRWKSMI